MELTLFARWTCGKSFSAARLAFIVGVAGLHGRWVAGSLSSMNLRVLGAMATRSGGEIIGDW